MTEIRAPYTAGPWKPCIRCGKLTYFTFSCPCDLQHSLCAACRLKVERLDCAHITGPRILHRCGEGFCVNPDHLAVEEED